MFDKKTFAVAEVRSTEGDSTSGEFEVILSAETLDRDGEIVDAKAFEPLPESIPFHAFHDFHDPIGRAVPFYDGGTLKARGTFASTPRAQEIRTLVTEGVIGHTSIGFMAAIRAEQGDQPPHVTKGELLEGSFVSVPSNRDAAVLVAKGLEERAGMRDSKDVEQQQSSHDFAVAHGAKCPAAVSDTTTAPVSPADEAGKTPASHVVESARLRARASLLSARLR